MLGSSRSRVEDTVHDTEAQVRSLIIRRARDNGEGGEHVEDQPPTRGGGVELFVQRSEPDVVAAQVGHDGDQVLQGAAESGQLGYHESVTFEELLESLGQAWAGSVLPESWSR